MEDPAFRKKYQKCKYIVKLWEKDFKKKNGRIPSKYDIHDASKDIRNAYKMYFNLKTSLLEETLSDVFSEDGFDLSVENSQENYQEESAISLPDMSTPLPVWGEEVSNKKQDEQKIETPVQTFKSSLNSKLFSQSSFSKRNPRKSLSRSNSALSKTGSNLSIGSDCGKELFPDLETILVEKSQQKAKEADILIANKKIKCVRNEVDRGWLNRHLSQTDSEGIPLSMSSSPPNSQRFGLSNVNSDLFEQLYKATASSHTENMNTLSQETKNVEPNIDNDSDSVISNSEDEAPKKRIEIVRSVLKRRKIEIENKTTQIMEVHSIPTVLASEKHLETEIDVQNKNVQTEDSEDESLKPKKKIKRTTKARKGKKVGTQNTQNKKSDKMENRVNRTTGKRRVLRSTKMKVPSNEVPDEQAEGPEDSCNLILDSNQVSFLPRINIKELDEAERVLQKYINDADPSISKMNTKENNNKKITSTANAREKLETKMSSGRANENFVRINLKKKTFVRGKKTLNYSKYKKGLWKQKKASALSGPDMDMRGCDGGIMVCFNCGLPGHFAQKCTAKSDKLLPLDTEIDDKSPFPTLEEAEEMANRKALVVHSQNIGSLPQASNDLLYRNDESEAEEIEIPEKEFKENDDNAILSTATEITEPRKMFIGHKIPEDLLQKAGLLNTTANDRRCGPFYTLKDNGDIIDMPDEVYEVLKMFGHSAFRKGQDRAIMRILSGVSTLVTLSTGSGKSLCYQLPAYLYSKKNKCITLVISPLVSLMEDQVHGVPEFLNAQCLHTNQTPLQRQTILEMINNGEVDVLLVSPEAIISGERSTGFGSILRNLPPIAFACIDEVHCVSQWSHNFRPSYLMICKVLKTKLGVQTILGLTATATYQTRESIIRHLNIPDGIDGIISDIPLPDNLFLSVSKDQNRDNALVELLRSPRFESCHSIIVYCTRRDECERIAGFIRTCMQDITPKITKRKRVNWHAEPYHAGMPAYRRRTIQKAFMQNELRIVVATIAFGMGINKADIRAVIHYNMPRNFESYVQEVGRAGRDGKPSHCHLFLDGKGSDQNELKRHIYANSIDRHVIRKLLQKVFVSCSCAKNVKKKEFADEYAKEIQAAQNVNWEDDLSTHSLTKKRICPGHEIGIPVDSTVEALDIPQENISTLLCYLELDGRWSLQTLSNGYVMCKIISYGGSAYIKKAAKECPPLAMAIALDIKSGKFDDQANIFEFSVIEIASAIGWNSGIVKHQLKNLEWTKVNDLPKRSSITVNFFELGFRIQSPGDFTNSELDEALDVLYNRSVMQEKTQLIQLQHVFVGLTSIAFNSYVQCSKKDLHIESSERLKNIIREYFKEDFVLNGEIELEIDTLHDNHIIQDVRSMINMYPENNFTGRTLARIFHGIQSPNYPALMWSRCKYWRVHSKVNFNHIVKIANAVIVEMRI